MRMLATFVGKPWKNRYFFCVTILDVEPHVLPVGKENITCYDAVSRRAGPLLSISAFCHNMVLSLRQSAPAGLS
jgi:hypothetical protein